MECNTIYYKKYIEKMIQQSPISVVLHRKTVADDGYGGTIETEVDLPAQTFRMYDKKYSRELVNDAGASYAYAPVITAKLLCSGDADILQEDTFSQDKKYRVANVEDYFGVCKQVELEVIA